MRRKVTAIFLSLAWLALFGFQVLDDLDLDGPTVRGSQPVKAVLVSVGHGNSLEEGLVAAPHKLPCQTKCFNAFAIKSAFSCRAEKEVRTQKGDLKLYKLHSVFLI